MNDRYDPVRAALPATLPPINRRQAAVIYAAIVRAFWPGSQSFTADDVSVRTVWLSREPTSRENIRKGLGRLVHDASHRVFRAVYRGSRRPHDPLHAKYETDIAAYVAAHLEHWVRPATPKPKPSSAERHARELAKTEDAIKRWTTKARRAATALKKLTAKRKRLEKLVDTTR